MRSATITVTGTAGPGQTVTAAVFSEVSSYTIDVANGILSMNQNGKIINISIAAATTMTVTITSGSQAVTIS